MGRGLRNDFSEWNDATTANVPRGDKRTAHTPGGYFFFLPAFFLAAFFAGAAAAGFAAAFFPFVKILSQFAENFGVGPVRTIGPDIDYSSMDSTL